MLPRKCRTAPAGRGDISGRGRCRWWFFSQLCLLLKKLRRQVTLAEAVNNSWIWPKDFLRERREIDRKLMQTDDLRFGDGEIDLQPWCVSCMLADQRRNSTKLRVMADDGYAPSSKCQLRPRSQPYQASA